MFAKSKTAMSGGSSGNARIAKKEDIDSVKATINEKIKTPDGDAFQAKAGRLYSFDKAVKIEYLENPDNPKAGDSSSRSMAFKVKGSATGYLLKKRLWPKRWRMIMPET